MVDTSAHSGYWTRQNVRPLGGTWDNELASELVLEDDGAGHLEGSYRSVAGITAGGTYSVRGSYDVHASGPGLVLGFVVDWGEHHSLTAWSGRYCPDDETIHATWIMTTQADEADVWRSTLIGHDVFHRRPPGTQPRISAHRQRWGRRVAARGGRSPRNPPGRAG